MTLCQHCQGDRWAIVDRQNVCAACGHPYEPLSPTLAIRVHDAGTTGDGVADQATRRRPFRFVVGVRRLRPTPRSSGSASI
ncbi:MAG: hypothetical protein ABSH51_17685 [Solirubrobacteraceae bacterium]|jgi:hypothetical protein